MPGALQKQPKHEPSNHKTQQLPTISKRSNRVQQREQKIVGAISNTFRFSLVQWEHSTPLFHKRELCGILRQRLVAKDTKQTTVIRSFTRIGSSRVSTPSVRLVRTLLWSGAWKVGHTRANNITVAAYPVIPRQQQTIPLLLQQSTPAISSKALAMTPYGTQYTSWLGENHSTEYNKRRQLVLELLGSGQRVKS